MTKVNKALIETPFVEGPNSSVNNRIAVFDGNTGKLLKDSGKLISELVPQAWEQIGPVVSASGAAQVAWSNLADFRFLRGRWDLIVTGNTGGLVAEISITNGASWQNGAADYRYEGKTLTNGAQTYLVPTDTLRMPMAGAVYGANWASGSIEFHAWNVPNAISPGRVYANLQSPSGWHTSEIELLSLFAGTKNAFRIYPIGGTMTGKFVLEGIRG